MIKLKEQYEKAVFPRFLKELGIDNALAVPRVVKVVVASGVGRAAQDEKQLQEITANLEIITGQKPIVRKAKKAIASFKVRQGAPVGLMITLRGKRMEDFLERLINIILPRMRDFKGLPRTGFDGRGNYTIGVREQIVFPEIAADKVQQLHGLQVTIHTSAKDNEQGQELLQALGFPFKKEE